VNPAPLYTRYPRSSVAIYHGSTLLHFFLGASAIGLGYSFLGWPAGLAATSYLVFALVEMYLGLPLAVCPNCVYYKLEGSRCISGLNLFSRRIAPPGRIEDFPKRAKGLLCPNNLYMVSLILPVVLAIPALFIQPSGRIWAIFLVLLALLLFRFFVVFPVLACLHCRAKYQCPQAGAMGVRKR